MSSSTSSTSSSSDPSLISTIKSTLGLQPESQSGTEPVSGETGQGTASKPYDQGNAAGQSGAAADEMGGEGEAGIGSREGKQGGN